VAYFIVICNNLNTLTWQYAAARRIGKLWAPLAYIFIFIRDFRILWLYNITRGFVLRSVLTSYSYLLHYTLPFQYSYLLTDGLTYCTISFQCSYSIQSCCYWIISIMLCYCYFYKTLIFYHAHHFWKLVFVPMVAWVIEAITDCLKSLAELKCCRHCHLLRPNTCFICSVRHCLMPHIKNDHFQ